MPEIICLSDKVCSRRGIDNEIDKNGVRRGRAADRGRLFGWASVTPAALRQFAIGVNFWDAPYTGLVDQLKIYDEAVNAEVVAQLSAEGTVKRPSWEQITVIDRS